MAEASDGQFACPHCGKKYRWKAGIAGRKVACKCGQKFRVPQQASGTVEAVGAPPEPAESSSDAGTYGLDMPEENAGPQGNRCPNCNQPMNPGAVLCIKCGYNRQQGQKLQTEIADDADEGDAPPGPPPQAAEDIKKLAENRPQLQQALKKAKEKDEKDKPTSPAKLIAVSLLLVVALGAIAFSLYSMFSG